MFCLHTFILPVLSGTKLDKSSFVAHPLRASSTFPWPYFLKKENTNSAFKKTCSVDCDWIFSFVVSVKICLQLLYSVLCTDLACSSSFCRRPTTTRAPASVPSLGSLNAMVVSKQIKLSIWSHLTKHEITPIKPDAKSDGVHVQVGISFVSTDRSFMRTWKRLAPHLLPLYACRSL